MGDPTGRRTFFCPAAPIQTIDARRAHRRAADVGARAMMMRAASFAPVDPYVLRSGACALAAGQLLVVNKTTTARAIELRPAGLDLGAARHLALAVGARAGAAVPAAELDAAPTAGAPAPAHAPLVITAARRAQLRGLTDEAVGMLAAGYAPPDPDPPRADEAPELGDLDAVLDLSAPHVPAPPPPPIADFVDYDLPPDVENRYLEAVNGHERDKRLRFVELSHTYYVMRADGVERPTNGSVTRLAHKYVEGFDGPAIIARMVAGKNWPRREYCLGAAGVSTVGEVQARYAGRLADLQLVWIDDAGRAVAACDFDIRRLRSADAAVVVAERSMRPAEVAATWKIKGMRAANRGTEAHMQVELFLNRDSCDTASPEFAAFAWFARVAMAPIGARAYRTEWRIFCEVANVAGSIDCIVRLGDGTVGIIDWKRSTKVRESVARAKWGGRGSPRMAAPMDHLLDNAVATYALQLNLYAHIIRAHYGETVSALVLTQIHPDDRFYTFVPDMPLEAAYIMAERRLENATAAPGGAATEEHATATAELGKAHAALIEGRVDWEQSMPREGIDIDGWRARRAAAAGGAPPPSACDVRQMFGLAPKSAAPAVCDARRVPGLAPTRAARAAPAARDARQMFGLPRKRARTVVPGV